MRILVDPTAAKDRACYTQVADALRSRRRGVLITNVRAVTHPEVTVRWFPQDALPSKADFPGAEAVHACVARETPRLLVENAEEPDARVEILAEPVIPRPRLLVAGGGHVGQALARHATQLGFDVTVVDQLLESRIDRVHVVVGREGSRIAEQLSGRPVTVVTNPDYQAGMLSSVRRGIESLPSECEAILVPLFRGKRGHPLLFSADYRDEVLTRYDDVGLRGLLRAHPDDVFELSVSTAAVLSDMDYPEDYRRQLALLRQRAQEKTTQGE